MRKSRKLPRIALIGAETLLGRDILEVLQKYEGLSLASFAANAEGGFGEEDGEAVYVKAFDEAALEAAEVVVIAGTEAGAEKVYQLALGSGGKRRVIDTTGLLDEKPEAWIVGAQTERETKGESWLAVVAHPAASILALLLPKLAGTGAIERAVIEVFEPASQLGKRGIQELQQQTTALLAFRPLERAVFDAQLSFSMLAAYGEDAPAKLTTSEQRIQNHLASLLGRTERAAPVPMPSLRLVQAPVFHGYSVSCWIEFAAIPDLGKIAAGLASEEIDVRGADLDAPTNVGAAGQTGIQIGDIRADPNNTHAIWLWAVADNLRLLAAAVERQLAGGEGAGR